MAIAWQRPGQALIEVIPANFSSVEIPCPSDWMTVKVNVTADNYPDEISWTLVSVCGTGITLSSSTNSYLDSSFRLSATECLPRGEYVFTITDTAGDGICCDFGRGEYVILVDGTAEQTGGQFGNSEKKTFGACPTSELSKLLGRKVRVQLKGQNYLHLTEVEIWDQNGTNVALNKTATQSSAYDAGNALNGIFTDWTNTSFDPGEYHLL